MNAADRTVLAQMLARGQLLLVASDDPRIQTELPEVKEIKLPIRIDEQILLDRLPREAWRRGRPLK